MTVGADAIALLAGSGQWRVEPGLTEAELDGIEDRFELRLGPEYRSFLAAGLPIGSGWPDWRHADELTLRMHIGRPVRELLAAVDGGAAAKAVSRELARHPREVPVSGVTYVRQGDSGDATVWAVQDGTVTAVAADLLGLARMLTGEPVEPPVPQAHPPFVALAPEVVPLPVPPFPADPPARALRAVRPPTDPAAALDLAVVTRHDDVLAHRAPMWTLPGGLALWERLRAAFPTTGLWPVLLTERTWHRIGLDGVADETSVLDPDLDGARWLADRFRAHAGEVARADIPFQPVGGRKWQQSFTDFDHDHEYTTLALIPTPADWLVPGLLQWSGAINYDVVGVHHAAVLRRWSDRYGSELVALDGEFLTLHVDRPPRDAQSARTAAVEAWLYCDDAVNTQAGSVDALAAMLTDQLWTFWWD